MRFYAAFIFGVLAVSVTAWAGLSGGTIGGSGASGGGGGGGGASEAYVDAAVATRLALDASNDPLTGALAVADGTVSLPGLTFAGETGGNSGLYLGANDDIRIAIGGAQMARWVSGTMYLGSSNTTYIDGVNSSTLTQYVGRGTRTDLLSGTNSGNTTAVARIGDSTGYIEVYGGGMTRESPAALAITATTDTTSSPVTSSACRISSTGVSAWTPSETGAVDGMHAVCVNTGANTITVTTSAGVCECGAGIAVPQWGAVELSYVTDRWVCTGSRI